MLLIIVILLVAYILVPLIDLSLNERVRLPVKIGVYLLALLYVIWETLHWPIGLGLNLRGVRGVDSIVGAEHPRDAQGLFLCPRQEKHLGKSDGR